jgi:CRP/FNR family cyclic AMP-dependent transcriptional regulator
MRFPRALEAVENCEDCSIHSRAFFCHLSPDAVQTFGTIKLTTLYPRGAVLFSEGQTPGGVYMLCQGRVKLTIGSAKGKMLILRILEPGELLGLAAAMSNAPHTATAETIEPCQVNFVRREVFLRFLREHHEACFRAVEHLGRNYNAACVQIRRLGLSHSALEKLAGLLLQWCNGHKSGLEREIRLKLQLTHEEIARMIGTSRETVSRLLSELKRREAIYLEGSTLIVRDKASLEGIIGG